MTDNGNESMKKRFLYPFLLLFILASCDQQILEQAVYSEDLFLKDNYVLNPLGGSFSFQVNAAGSWSLTKPDWLVASRVSGRGMQTISMSADANTTGSLLSGEIVINSSEIKRIRVSQANPYAYLDNNVPLQFKWNKNSEMDEGAERPVSVQSNLYWRLVPVGEEATEPHFALSTHEGFGDATVSVSPMDQNLGTQEWRAYYRLTSYVDSARTRPVENIPGISADSISLVQRNYEFLLNGEPSATVVFGRSNFQTESFEITLDSESGSSPGWSIASNPNSSWLNVTKANNSTLQVVPVSANVTKYDRSGRVTLESNTGAQRYLDVRQEKYLFYFLKNGVETDLLNFANEGGTQDITFVSSGPWRIEGNTPTGVEFNPTSGVEGETPIQITLSEQNLDLKPLLNNIVIRSNDPALAGIVLKDTLALQQKEFSFQILQPLDTLGSGEGSTRQFTLLSSGPWKIDDYPNWVSVSPESSDQGGTFTITVRTLSENANEKEHRVSTMRVVCTLNSKALRREFPVVQMRTLFDLSTSSFSSVSAYNDPNPVCTTTLTSTQDWSIVSVPGWISVSPTSGNASDVPVSLYFTVFTNTSKYARSGAVVIRNQSGKERQVNFNQDGLNFSVTGQDFSDQPATGASKQTQVTCYPTVPWSVLDVPSWVSPSSVSGKGNGTITFTIQPNSGTIESNGSEARSGSARIFNNITGEEYGISFSQAGYRWSVTNATSYKFSAFKGDKTPEFTITSSGRWRIDVPDWISASTSQGSGTGRVTLTTIKDNAPASSVRSGVVTVVCEDFYTLSKTIQVQQEKYNLSASPSSITFNKKKDQSAILTVTADGPWTARTDASWLSLSPTSGSAGTTSVVVKTTAKNSGSNREGKIIISDSKYSSLPSITVTVTQTNKQ